MANNPSEIRIVAKNTLYQVVSKLITIALSFVATFFFTRKLGQEGYGAYTFTTAFVLMFSNFSDWGTSIIAVREGAKSGSTRERLWTTVAWLRLALALISLILANVVIRVNPNWNVFVNSVTIGSLVLVFLSVKSTFFSIFQSRLRLDKATILDLTSSFVFVVLSLFSLLVNKGLTGIMVSWVISVAISMLVGIFILKNKSNLFIFDKAIARGLFKESLPVGATLVVFSVYNRIDTLLLAHYWGEAEVGVYGLSYKVYENLSLGAAFFMNSLFPLLSNLRENKKEVYSLFSRGLTTLTTCSIILVVGVVLFAPLMVAILGGKDFLMSTIPLRLLSVALIFTYINHVTGYTLVALGEQKKSLYIAIVALIINLSLNMVFIPIFSFNGAATITVITEFSVSILSLLVLRKILGGLPTKEDFITNLRVLVFSITKQR